MGGKQSRRQLSSFLHHAVVRVAILVLTLNLGTLTTRTVIYSSYLSCLLNTHDPADHHTKPVRQSFPN